MTRVAGYNGISATISGDAFLEKMSGRYSDGMHFGVMRRKWHMHAARVTIRADHDSAKHYSTGRMTVERFS